MWKKLNDIILIFSSIIVALLIAETTLRFIKPHNNFYPLDPNLSIEANLYLNNLFPGLTDTFKYTTNDQGYRSNSKFSKERYGILVLGGSTTECSVVGDNNLWTNILEENLNNISKQKVIIGNIGASGLNSQHHLAQLRQLSSNYEGLKAVMMLVGINDFLLDLHYPEKVLDSVYIARRAFKQYPRKFNPKWYQRTEIFMHMRDIKNQFSSRGNFFNGEKITSEVTKSRNNFRQKSPTLDLPDLSAKLSKYKKNIQSIYDICQQDGLELILVTQPVLWHKQMTQYEWELSSTMVVSQGDKTYSPAAYNKGMEEYNDVLRSFEQNDGIVLLDLARELPKDTSVFYDYCHFNINGSKKVAEILFSKLVAQFNQ